MPGLRTNEAIRLTKTVMQLNSVFNPLLYCYREQRFRNAIRELSGLKKPRAIQPAVGVAQSCCRKDPVRLKAEKRTQILTRSTSCNVAYASDSFHFLTPSVVMLKKSLSAPTLDTWNSSLHGLDLQQPSSIVETSATIRADSGVHSCAR